MHFLFFFFSPKIFFSPYFLYIAARHSNNFFHKLCSSIALTGRGLFRLVPLGYTFENPKFLLYPTKMVFSVNFFNPQILFKRDSSSKYWMTSHSNNFFHKLCPSDTLIGGGLCAPVPLGYTFEKPKFLLYSSFFFFCTAIFFLVLMFC